MFEMEYLCECLFPVREFGLNQSECVLARVDGQVRVNIWKTNRWWVAFFRKKLSESSKILASESLMPVCRGW